MRSVALLGRYGRRYRWGVRFAVAQDLEWVAAYLARTHRGPESTYPPLWIAKCLYAPYDMVRAAILAALILYEDIFGHTP